MADLDANHDVEIISVAAVFGTLMVACFIARIVSIRLRRNAFGLDDLLLTVALVRTHRKPYTYPDFTNSKAAVCFGRDNFVCCWYIRFPMAEFRNRFVLTAIIQQRTLLVLATMSLL